MKSVLDILSTPYEAELKLKISEQMITAIIKQFAIYTGIKDINIVCRDRYLNITVEVGISILGKKSKIELELSSILFEDNQLVITQSDKHNSLNTLSAILGLLRLDSISIVTIQNGAIQINLSDILYDTLSHYPETIKKQIKSIKIIQHRVNEGSLEVRLLKPMRGLPG